MTKVDDVIGLICISRFYLKWRLVRSVTIVCTVKLANGRKGLNKGGNQLLTKTVKSLVSEIVHGFELFVHHLILLVTATPQATEVNEMAVDVTYEQV